MAQNFYAFYPPVGSNPSVGTNGSPAPTSSTEVAGINPGGNLQPLQTDNAGNLKVSLAADPIDPLGVNIEQVGGAPISEGQKTSASSFPVVIASDQSAVPISAASLPLPTGASTSALQSNVQSAPGSAAGTALTIQGNASGIAVPISAASLPLPTGAATSANQTNGSQETQIVQGGNTAVVSAAGALKVDGSAATQPVSGTVTAVQPSGANLHVNVDNFPATQPVSGTVTANQGTANATPWNENIAQYGGVATTLGQKVSASSIPVVIASDQSAVPVSGTVTATNSANGNTGAAVPTQSTQVGGSDGTNLRALSVNASGQLNVNNISGTVSLPTGASTSANQTNGTQQTQIVQGGNTAAVSASNALKVDGSAVTQPVSGTVTANAGTGTFVTSEVAAASSSVTSVAGSASSVSLLALNANRKQAAFFNDSTQILYLKLGTTASLTSYTVQIPPNGYYELPNGKIYSGAIDGIWASANGNARITELS